MALIQVHMENTSSFWILPKAVNPGTAAKMRCFHGEVLNTQTGNNKHAEQVHLSTTLLSVLSRQEVKHNQKNYNIKSFQVRNEHFTLVEMPR